jgi:hypothetical protein
MDGVLLHSSGYSSTGLQWSGLQSGLEWSGVRLRPLQYSSGVQRLYLGCALIGRSHAKLASHWLELVCKQSKHNVLELEIGTLRLNLHI